MANSRKSKSDLTQRVAATLEPVVPAGSTLLVGLSGGMDSVVLLHLLRQVAPRYSWHISALHVHHGISSHAGDWAAFCLELCEGMGVPCLVERVTIAPLREMGIEAAARKLRHAALDRQPADFIVLAHHLDDQAETLLLQLLRGSGPRGAAAMPLLRERPGLPAQLRPLLDATRSELLAYAQQHGLRWVEDESNADDAYPRNFLRLRVLPLLEQRFPAYRETLGRSVRHFAEASALLDELALQDAQGALHGDSLEVGRLQALPPHRARNLLRSFLYQLGAPMPQSVQLDTMLQQLCGARRDAAVLLEFGGWQIRRYQGRAYALPQLPEPDKTIRVRWQGEVRLELPELGGVLYFEHADGTGVSLEKLKRDAVTVRLRQGAEKIRTDCRRPTRILKKLLQELGIPPWRRERLPLLFCGEELAAVAGVGVACNYQAGPGEAGVVPRWEVS